MTTEKVKKPVENLNDKKKHVIYIRKLKEAPMRELALTICTEFTISLKKLGYNHIVM